MSNPYFTGEYSTNQMYVDLDTEYCLTQKLEEMDEAIAGKAESAHAHTEYAASGHTHSGYAASDHTHSGYAATDHTHSGYAASDHTHGNYAAVDHTHTGFAAESHTHSQYASSDHTHTGFAASAHTHAQGDITNLAETLGAKADLVDGVVPASQLPSYVDDVLEYANLAAFPTAGTSGKVYLAQDTNKSYRWSGSQYVVIGDGGVALGETSATAYRGDRGKTAYDHSQNGDVHVTAAQKAAWDSKAAGNHTHSDYSSINHTHDYAAPDHTHSAYAPISHTHSDYAAASHAHSDYAAASHSHSNYAETGHNHDTEYIAKALQFLNDGGGVKYSYGSGSTANLLTEIAAMGQGMHTTYSIAGLAGNPNTSDSFRCVIHKTAVGYGWVLAFGNSGSIFSNYIDNGTWMGWRSVYEVNPAPLWTGSWYMNAAQTVTPSKTLSQCRNGWVLVWSDFDTSGNAAVNSEACTTVIPKRGFTGGIWTGQAFLAVLPAAVTESADAITIKRVQVYDAYLTGHAYNTVAPRNDIVLRAIYEY